MPQPLSLRLHSSRSLALCTCNWSTVHGQPCPGWWQGGDTEKSRILHTGHIPPFWFGKELKSAKHPSVQSSRHFRSLVCLFMKAAEMDSGLSTSASDLFLNMCCSLLVTIWWCSLLSFSSPMRRRFTFTSAP